MLNLSGIKRRQALQALCPGHDIHHHARVVMHEDVHRNAAALRIPDNHRQRRIVRAIARRLALPIWQQEPDLGTHPFRRSGSQVKTCQDRPYTDETEDGFP